MLQGEILIDCSRVDIRSPKDALKHGLVLLTEDRKGQGLVLNNSVLFNATLANLKKYLSGILLDLDAQRQDAVRVIKYLRINKPSLNTLVSQLIGVNKQKVVIGKGLIQRQIFSYLMSRPADRCWRQDRGVQHH